MKSINQILILSFLIGSLSFFNSCKKDNEILSTDYGIFSSQDDNTATLDGVIDSDTPIHWDNFIAAFPNTNKLILIDGPGSTDDEANLELSRKIRNQNIATHLPANAEIASDAVDLFIAGTTRTRGPGGKFGVHAWADETSEATDYPVGDEIHQPYIDYYMDMGFSQTDAEAFYYFTINIASHDEIHWMTDAEVEQYKLLTP